MEYTPGQLIRTGKSKEVYECYRHGKLRKDLVYVRNTDRLTAGNGERDEIVPGIGRLINEVNMLNMQLFNTLGLKVAFLTMVNEVDFIAERCDMIPIEVVVRRFARGSYVKRHPFFENGERFTEPEIEFYLKTTGRRWKDQNLPCDDPLMIYRDGGRTYLYRPDVELAQQDEFLILDWDEDPLPDPGHREYICQAAYELFVALEIATTGIDDIHDVKFEFGINQKGEIVLADTVGPGEWRTKLGADKQRYREGASHQAVIACYHIAAQMTRKFADPDG